MRNITTNLLLMVGLLSSCQNDKIDSNKTERTISQKYAQFNIVFPENDFPLRKRTSQSMYHKGNAINDWILEGREENSAFVYFLSQDYIDASITKLSISSAVGKEAFLSGLLSSSISKFNPTNVTLKAGTYKKFSLVEARGEIIGKEHTGIAKYRAFTNGFDFFLIGVAGQNYNDSIANQFLNSFEIISNSP